LLLVLLFTGLAGPADAADTHPGPHPTKTASLPTSPLTLLDQTPWVTAGQHFVLQLEAGRGAPPVAHLGLSVAVYPCLSSVSGFEQSVSAVPSGNPISSTDTPLPVKGLPSTAGGGFELSLPVTTGDGAANASGSFTLDLASAPDQCGLYPYGVYPIRVDLVDTSGGRVIGGITTHIIYTDAPPGTQKLRLALVLPLRATITASPTPTTTALVGNPDEALAPLSPAALGAVTGTVNAIAQYPSVPVTIEASGQTIDALQSSGHQSTVSRLSTLAVNPDVHQFTSSTFTPVDASSLVTSGLGNELSLQIGRGATIVSTAVTHRPVTPTQQGAWISDEGLDGAALTQLRANGYSQVIVPAATVGSPPTDGSAALPFVMTSNTGTSMTAFASTLSTRFVRPIDNPVLAAHQLVAELAQIYYEQPNDDTPRAVVAVPPRGWTDDPAFVKALLSSLAGNPIIQPVTTNQLFDTFRNPTVCRVGCRPTAPRTGAALPVDAINAQRQDINGFATAAPNARSVILPLEDMVLAGESDLLEPVQRAAVLRNTDAALNAQLSQLQVADGQSITLTSQNGTLPIDIVSSAPYAVRAILTITSDKLLFANGLTGWTHTTTIVPGHNHSNVIYVKVRARTSGVFTVPIMLTSPTGVLRLASGQIVVRSTTTSIVGIILSVGAVAVLAAWWVRTSRKRRSLRRAEEGPDPEVSTER
jgi:Family of unknown function (DUF6049)